MLVNRNYSTIFRVTHWLIAITFLLLLLTIFLRLTWLNKENLSIILENYLLSKKIELPKDEIIILAKQIRKPMWEWHIYLGYLLTGLYLFRMTLAATKKMEFVNPINRAFSLKEKLHYLVYLVFYLLVAVSLVTGLLIVHGPKDLKTPLETVHELSIYYLLAFIFIHIGGVLLAEMTSSPGIVSKMIRGRFDKI